MPFGEWLTEQVQKRGWNASYLAARMKVRPSTVYRWMNNKREMRPEYVQPLARELGLHPDEVFAALDWRPLDRPAEVFEIIRITERMSADQQRIRLLREQVKGGQHVSVPLIGRVPADTVRWTDIEGGQTVVDVPREWLRGARHPFAVEVSGNCLQSLKILDGDIVICDDREGEEPPEGKVTLVRIGNEITFKRWYRVSSTAIELRDGDGAVVYRLTDRDDFEVKGIALHRLGDFD